MAIISLLLFVTFFLSKYIFVTQIVEKINTKTVTVYDNVLSELSGLQCECSNDYFMISWKILYDDTIKTFQCITKCIPISFEQFSASSSTRESEGTIMSDHMLIYLDRIKVECKSDELLYKFYFDAYEGPFGLFSSIKKVRYKYYCAKYLSSLTLTCQTKNFPDSPLENSTHSIDYYSSFLYNYLVGESNAASSEILRSFQMQIRYTTCGNFHQFYFTATICKHFGITGCLTPNLIDNTCTQCDTANSYYSKGSPSIDGLCYQLPVNGYYLTTGNYLDTCHLHCQSCQEKGTDQDNKCTSCISGNAFIENTSNCFSSTSHIDGYYLDESSSPLTFKLCFYTCSNCISSGTETYHHCTSCTSEYYCLENAPISNTSYNCYNSPPKQTYLNTSINEYSPCYQTCEKCNVRGTSNSHNCITCINNYHFTDEESSTMCFTSTDAEIKYHYYLNKELKQWKKCYHSCLTCTQAETPQTHNCDTCVSDYFHVIDMDNMCYSEEDRINNSSVLSNYFLASDIWDKCYSSCATCIQSGNESQHNCITCKTDYFPLENNNKTCYSLEEGNNNSSFNYYLNATLWRECYVSCAKCDGQLIETNHHCLVCANEYYPLPDFNTSCYSPVSLPAPGIYYFETSQWNKCVLPCKECSTKRSCLSCVAGYFLQGDQCMACASLCNQCTSLTNCLSCANKAYNDKGICKNCVSPCLTCTSQTTCLTCITATNSAPEYFLFEGTCINTCPNGQFFSSDARTCLNCQKVCAKCKSDTNYCVQCANSAFVFQVKEPYDGIGYQCLYECPMDYYPDTFGICKTCFEIGNVMMNGKCVKFCDQGLYADSNGVCGLCTKFKFQTKCVDACPPNYQPDQSQFCIQTPTPEKNETDIINTGPNCASNDPCQNGGLCRVSGGLLTCDCLPGTSGDTCENVKSIAQAIENLGSTTQLTNSTMSLLNNLNDMMKANSSSITPELVDKVYEFTQNQLNLALSGHAAPTANALKATSITFAMQLTQNKNDNQSSVELQNKINSLKSSIGSYVDLIIKSNDTGEAVTLVNDMLSIQYASSSNQDSLEETAYRNNISTISFPECEESLKEFYHLPSNTSLVIKKIDFSAMLNLEAVKSLDASNTVAFEFFNPITKEKLNHQEVCKNISISINTPLKTTQDSKILSLYSNISKLGMDMYDKSSPGFNSRCVKVANPGSGADTSVNYRIGNFFQNQSLSCGTGCTYGGVNEHGYVNCSCTGASTGGEVSSNLEPAFLEAFPQINIDIIICFGNGFTYPDIFFNPAFYLISLFIILAFIGSTLFAFKMVELHLIKNHIDQLIRFDAKFYEKEMPMEIYFNPEAANCEINNQNPVSYLKEENAIENIKIDLKDKGEYPIQVGAPGNANACNSKICSSNDAPFPLGVSHRSYKQFPPNSCSELVSEDIKNYVMFKCSFSQLDDLSDINIKKASALAKFKKHKVYPTIKDYEYLTPLQATLYDKRPFFHMLLDFIVEENLLVWLVMKKSLLEPLWYRIFFLFFNLSLMFALNALLFSDDYIDKRANVDENTRNSFWFTFENEITKTILSLVIATAILFVVSFTSSPSSKVEEKLNEALKTCDRAEIENAYDDYRNAMRFKFRFFIILTLLINFFCWFYVITFCGVYEKSRLGWINGAGTGLCIDWFGMSLGIPLFRVCLRMITRRYKIVRYLAFFEYFIWLKMFFG